MYENSLDIQGLYSTEVQCVASRAVLYECSIYPGPYFYRYRECYIARTNESAVANQIVVSFVYWLFSAKEIGSY